MPTRVRVARMALLIAGVAAIASGVAVAVHPPANAATTPLPAASPPTLPDQGSTRTRTVGVGGSIQAAIDDLAATGGGTVALTAGTHQVTTPIQLRSNVTLSGHSSTGTNPTTLHNAAGSDMVAMLDGSSGGLSNVIIQRIKVDCALTAVQRGSTANPGKNYGVYITDTVAPNDRILLDSVQITACAVGFHTRGTSDLTVRNCDIHHNGGSSRAFHNVYLRGVSRARLESSTFNGSNSGNGLDVSYSDNITVFQVTANGNAVRGIRFAESDHVDVLVCIATGNTDAGIVMNSEAKGVQTFRIHGDTATGNRVGVATSANSNQGEIWNNVITGNAVNLDVESSETDIR